MLKWLRGSTERGGGAETFLDVTTGLQGLYKDVVLPVEQDHAFHHCYSPPLTDADFAARPMVLLIGQYSAGKSTFIRHLLGRDFPGMRIGPEPTTDKWVAVCKGPQDQIIPGNAAVVDTSMPFTQLQHFGNGFLNRFEVAMLDSPVLKGITFIDTPGVLSGEKQRVQRGYEYEVICEWFADRVDLILLLFDVSKLDISDEFRRTILALKGNTNKIHILLNKADQCSTPQLMRVYGALMWNLGKVIDTAEVSRVYISSFWDQPLRFDDMRKLFESEENDLYTALAMVPSRAAIRKLNDLIKRARLAKVHALLCDSLRKKMPSVMGKAKVQKKLIEDLSTSYREVSKEHSLPLGDFAEPATLGPKLQVLDFSKFPKLSRRKIEALDAMLSVEVPKLLRMIPSEADHHTTAELANVANHSPTPFSVMKVNGATEDTFFSVAFSELDPDDYAEQFHALGPIGGYLSGQQAKLEMVKSKLPSNVLHKIWVLSDRDEDGKLSLDEFSRAMHLIKMKIAGHDLPDALASKAKLDAPKADGPEAV